MNRRPASSVGRSVVITAMTYGVVAVAVDDPDVVERVVQRPVLCAISVPGGSGSGIKPL